MGLLPHWGPVRVNPIKSAALNSHQFLLRQNFSGKPGPVTATDLVNYWQEVFEANRIPEAQESSEYIVSYVLGAKTVKWYENDDGYREQSSAELLNPQQINSKVLNKSLISPYPYFILLQTGKSNIFLSYIGVVKHYWLFEDTLFFFNAFYRVI